MTKYIDTIEISNGSKYDVYFTSEPLMNVYRLTLKEPDRPIAPVELPLDMNKLGYRGNVCLLRERDSVEISYVYKRIVPIHVAMEFDDTCVCDDSDDPIIGMLVLVSHKDDADVEEMINENAKRAKAILKAKTDAFMARVKELLETKKPRRIS